MLLIFGLLIAFVMLALIDTFWWSKFAPAPAEVEFWREKARRYKQQRDTVANELDELEILQERMVRRLQAATTQRDFVQKKFKKSHQECGTLRTDLTQERERHVAAKAERDALRQEKLRLERQAASLNQKFEESQRNEEHLKSVNAKVIADNEWLNEKQDRFKSEVAELNARCEILEQNKLSVIHKLTVAKSELSNLQGKLARTSGELDQLQAELLGAKEKRDLFQHQAEQADTATAKALNEVEALRQEIEREKRDAAAHLAQLQGNFASENEKLRVQRDEAEAVASRHAAEVDLLRTDLKQAELRLTDSKQELEHQRQQVLNDFVLARKKAEDTEVMLRQARETSEELKAQIAESRKRFEIERTTLLRDLARIEAQNGCLEREFKQHSDLVERLFRLQASSRRPFDRPAWMDSDQVHVGFDYGTHSTKVMARIRNSEAAPFVLFLDEQAGRSSMPCFGTPSTVCMHDDRVYFGREADEKPGERFLSLKTRLFEEANDAAELHELLVVLYWAWALGRIKEVLGFSKKEVQFTLSIAAPIITKLGEELIPKYQRIMYAAWRSVFGPRPIPVVQGVDFATCKLAFTPLLREAPPHDFPCFDVRPETLSALVSLSRQPNVDPGVYLMLDMGAGTTEIQISKFYLDVDSVRKITYYRGGRSIAIAGDNFVSRNRSNGASGLCLTPDEEGLLPKLQGQILDVFNTAYRYVARPPIEAEKEKWRKIRVVLAGGGLKHPCVRKAIESYSPVAASQYFLNEPDSTRHIAHEIVTELHSHGYSTTPIAEGDRVFLAVADGLCRERWLEHSDFGGASQPDERMEDRPPRYHE